MVDHAFRQKRAMVAQLWKDMAAAYGSLWTKDGGVESERFATWVDNLCDFTTNEIREGVLRVRKRTDKYPPTLPEFRGVIESARPYKPPQNMPDPDMRQLEANGKKLLAGKMADSQNRIVRKTNGTYVHQMKVNGKWEDQPAWEDHPANPVRRK